MPYELRQWDKQLTVSGAMGGDIDVDPDDNTLQGAGTKNLYEMSITVVNGVPNEDATIDIFKDTNAAANKAVPTFQLSHLKPGGVIELPKGFVCTDKWIVNVTGGTGTVHITARYR